MTKSEQARKSARTLSQTNDRPVYVYTTPQGEYVLTLVEKSESYEGESLTLVEIVDAALL